MIDIEKAKIAFKNYVSNFDSNDGKINLKIIHILNVADISKNIANMNGFNDEEIKLAELIGLLHDIGRFEQIKKYNTFLDSKSENHSKIAIRVLFEQGYIKDFVDDRKYDEIIKVAILNHNKAKIDESLSSDEMKFCEVIRDADKLDIYRVLLEEKIENIYDSANLENELISNEVYNEFKNDHYINYSHINSSVDLMVAHIAYVYDFNYNYCLKKIKDGKYLEKLVGRICFKNEDTDKKMHELLQIANEYMNSKLSQK